MWLITVNASVYMLVISCEKKGSGTHSGKRLSNGKMYLTRDYICFYTKLLGRDYKVIYIFYFPGLVMFHRFNLNVINCEGEDQV